VPVHGGALAAGDSGRLRAVLLGTMAVWGVNLSAIKLLTLQIDVLPLACLRMALSTGVMLLFCRGALAGLRRVDRRQAIALVLCATTMVYANQVLAMSGMSRTSTTNTALIVALSPIAGMLVAGLVAMERVRPLAWLGAALGFAGVALVILGRPAAAVSGIATGDVLVLLSVLAFAGGSALVPRLARSLDTMAISVTTHGIGAVLLLAHTVMFSAAPIGGVLHWSWWTWALLLFSGAGASGLGNLVWTRSLSRLGMGRTTSALYWVPIFGIGFAAVLGEPLTAWHGIGLAAVLAGTRLAAAGAPSSRTTSRPSA